MRRGILLGLIMAGFLAHASAVAESAIHDIPLQSSEGWELHTFSSVQANQVSFSNLGMLFDVNASASPIIYPLPEGKSINEVSLRAEIYGYLNLDGKSQGEKNADDFVLRLGLVHAGEKQLNFLQRSIAPGWINRLYELAPDDTGISHIEFYNVYSDRSLSGKSRIHPLSDLMLENFITPRPTDSNRVVMQFKPESDKPVLALWISIDGDDTKSNYQVLLKELRLKSD